MVKYKGQTSKLLMELSRELKLPVNLKNTETILQHFFQTLLNEIDANNRIKLVTVVPSYLKPFCHLSKETMDINHSLFQNDQVENTFISIFNTLKNFVTADILNFLYNCLPKNFIKVISTSLKEVSLAA